MTTRFKTAFAAGLVAVTLAGAAPHVLAQDAPRQRRGGPEMAPMRGPDSDQSSAAST